MSIFKVCKTWNTLYTIRTTLPLTSPYTTLDNHKTRKVYVRQSEYMESINDNRIRDTMIMEGHLTVKYKLNPEYSDLLPLYSVRRLKHGQILFFLEHYK